MKVGVKPLGARQQGQEQRQSKVRSAAGELFRTRGYDATSVRDIAVAAGVSVGTVAHLGDNPELTRAYLIAYLRADGSHATSVGQVDVICAGLAARCVEHSGGDPGAPEALLAASAIYALFFSAAFSLAGGLGSAGEVAQWLRDLIAQQTRPFERAAMSAGVSS